MCSSDLVRRPGLGRPESMPVLGQSGSSGRPGTVPGRPRSPGRRPKSVPGRGQGRRRRAWYQCVPVSPAPGRVRRDARTGPMCGFRRFRALFPPVSVKWVKGWKGWSLRRATGERGPGQKHGDDRRALGRVVVAVQRHGRFGAYRIALFDFPLF